MASPEGYINVVHQVVIVTLPIKKYKTGQPLLLHTIEYHWTPVFKFYNRIANVALHEFGTKEESSSF